MGFKTDLLGDLDGTFFNTDEFAEAAVYTPAGGSAANVAIIREDQDPAITPDAPPGDSLIIRARTSEVATPRRGDAFTIGGETWYLQAAIGVNSGEVRLQLTRSDKRRV